MTNPLQPAVSVLSKLGSLVEHVGELLSADGHEFDRVALLQLVADAEVVAWMNSMDKMALIPKRRKP